MLPRSRRLSLALGRCSLPVAPRHPFREAAERSHLADQVIGLPGSHRTDESGLGSGPLTGAGSEKPGPLPQLRSQLDQQIPGTAQSPPTRPNPRLTALGEYRCSGPQSSQMCSGITGFGLGLGGCLDQFGPRMSQ